MSPEEQFAEIDREGQWNYVYHRIREDSKINNFTVNAAKRPEYRTRNRYRDVSPYDHSRVVLERCDVDYINASYVEHVDANRRYILTQGPLEETASHFWLMVWENKCRAILMLNRIIEKGVVKCYQYYPDGKSNYDTVMTFDDVGLEVTFKSEKDYSYYTVRTLQLTDTQTNESKEILQFHYTMWPDFGVPESPAAFLDFLFAVRNSGALSPDVGPPVIHCSAGIGRSGTFCLVDVTLVLIEKQQNSNGVDVIELLLQLRQYRTGLIQTPDQLRFSYLAIIEGTRHILNIENEDTGISSMSSGTSDGSINSSDKRRDMFQNGPGRHVDNEEDDIPTEPPPPPPRVFPAHSAPDSNDNKNGNQNVPEKDPATPTTSETSQTSQNHSPSQTELRRRKREERIRTTAAQIERMKEKQHSSEIWKGRKQSFRPVVIGLGLAALIGSFIIYRYYYTSS